MPTYVYRREDGTTFELQQRITADALTVDPETGQRVERVISGAGLVFKGSGFYLTDYARKGASSAEGKADAKAEADAGPKPEAKPADTPAPKADAAPAKPPSSPTPPPTPPSKD